MVRAGALDDYTLINNNATAANDGAPLQIDQSARQIDQLAVGGTADVIIIIIAKLAVGQINGPGIGQRPLMTIPNEFTFTSPPCATVNPAANEAPRLFNTPPLATPTVPFMVEPK